MSDLVKRPLPEAPLRLAVLISGGGTTLENLALRIQEGHLRAEIALVIASRPEIAGIPRAEKLGLTVDLLPRKSFPSVEEFSNALFDRIRRAEAELVVLGGFLTLIRVPRDFQGRVINIHPSLIPAFCGRGFYGEHVHRAVLEMGCKVSGCTVHFVDDEYDHGPIIAQTAVRVEEGDTPQTLHERVFKAECETLIQVIQMVANNQIELKGRQVRIIPSCEG